MEPNGLEARVQALEAQVHQLDQRVRASEQDAAAARVLAGAADRDVTEFHADLRDFRQATVASFNALRTEMIERFAQVDNGLVEVRGQLDAAAAGQQHVVGLLERLIADQG